MDCRTPVISARLRTLKESGEARDRAGYGQGLAVSDQAP